ncbi:kinase suppressor of Ras 2 [Phytophthora boehmeriae]|uniref:Kinase suppressor of Ras 2 n=1 Tax=Phytophthora boehmeriae TaxID=109152 RepID=A0A8T1WPY6_9STRA|nr:kinase suppressor of Ras 2 [Phytophthora boehmeriae]
MRRVNRWLRSNCPAKVRKTEDRVGDYVVALYFDFIAKHKDCKRGLNIRGDLSAYESERRELVKLAATGKVVSILLRFGRVLESYLEVLNVSKSEDVKQWRNQLELERQERVEFFQAVLSDESRLVKAMGDECQQVEILTLLKRDLERYEDILTPGELDVMSEVYDRVVYHSGIVTVGPSPSWFLSPNEVISHASGYFLDDVRVSKCLVGGALDAQSCWEYKEETCLREAATWADLNHPHVAKLLGGCHIGKHPFLIHEAAEPMIKNRANAHTWKPLLGWALGLQYLHERELGYKSFANDNLLVRHSVTSSGVLSGLGLVPVKRQLKASLERGVSDVFRLESLAASLQMNNDEDIATRQTTWSVPDDVYAFGMAIYSTRQWATMNGDNEVHELPWECPRFLAEHEWDLIKKMCVRAPHERVNMWYVVHQLQAFVTATEANNRKTPVDFSVSSGPADDDLMEETDSYKPEKIDDFIVAEMHAKVVEAMPRLEEMYQDMSESSEMLGHVLDRLSTVRTQLQTPEYIDDATAVMHGFSDLLGQFYALIKRRQSEKKQPSSSTVTEFCEARAAAQNISSFHHEIDRLLALAGTPAASAHDHPAPLTLSSSRGSSSDSIDSVFDDVHDWKKVWNKKRRQQLRDFQKCLENIPALKQTLSNPEAREEAQMLLQFEANKRRGSYPDSVLKAIENALEVLEDLDGGEPSEAVPNWFIPPYEVELGNYISQGSFADVYYGKWFDTDVVVKILKPQSSSAPTSSSSNSDEDPVDVFRREADHWFMLSHQNVVHLYGACHVGRPFFVCEPAKTTSLSAHMESLAHQNASYDPEQRGGNSSDIMRCLYLVGLGLKYLHERGIIHSDLKKNNFMVGTDEKNIKLGDFGLSVVKRRGGGSNKNYVVPGAYRWKAPECLLGAEPSVESDIYSFGMCILEIFSGAFPWGNNLAELAVKFYVTKKKQLPPRPRGLKDIQWSMVQRMCCFEPTERISLAAVVDMLNAFRFEEPQMGCK